MFPVKVAEKVFRPFWQPPYGSQIYDLTGSRPDSGILPGCAAFETMREELLLTNQELWRQAEERRRLNAAFAHDLRNPVTVLKGTVKQLRQGGGT